MEDLSDQREFRMRVGEAAEYLGVSKGTVKKMEKEGGLVSLRTPRGHRRYSLEILKQYVQSNRRRNRLWN